MAEQPQIIDGLVAHWPLDDPAGVTASEVTGLYAATLTNGAMWTAGRFAGAVHLDGVRAYIAPPAIDVFGNALTLAAWVNIAEFSAGGDQRIISKSTGTATQAHYWMLSHVRTDGRNRLRFRLKTGSVTTLTATRGDLPVNTWFHAAATYDGTTMRVYLNGVEVGSTQKLGPIASDVAAPVNIGRSPDGTNYLHGVIDDVRIYERALGETDLAQVMNDAGDSAADVVPPTRPSSVAATPLSSTQMHVHWSPSADTRGVAGYRVTRNGISVATNVTSYVESGLTPSTRYTYTVSAFDGAGNESSQSATASAATPAAEVAALGPAAVAAAEILSMMRGGSINDPATGGPASPAANQAPSVSIVNPTTGVALTGPGTVTITASASDPENRLTEVQFYAGTILLGRDTTTPYSYTWSSVPVGLSALTAVARDADGGSTISAVVWLYAPPQVTPWYVAFTASADHHTTVTSYVLEIYPAGSDPNVAVAFKSSDLGKPAPAVNGEIKVDRRALLEGLPIGSYLITVRAVAVGGSSRSAAYTFTR